MKLKHIHISIALIVSIVGILIIQGCLSVSFVHQKHAASSTHEINLPLVIEESDNDDENVFDCEWSPEFLYTHTPYFVDFKSATTFVNSSYTSAKLQNYLYLIYRSLRI